ncbi:MAG: hypothetical protein WBP13_05485 [Methylophilaceae bacterium]
MHAAFEILGLNTDADERTVKRAYAKCIKEFRPDSHPVEFARVREAYENALEYIRNRAYWADYEEDDALDHDHDSLDALSQVDSIVDSGLEDDSKAIPAYRRVAENEQKIEQNATLLADEYISETLEIPPYQRQYSAKLTEAELFKLIDAKELNQESQSVDDIHFEESEPEPANHQLTQTLPQAINQMMFELGQFELPQQELGALNCFNLQLKQLGQMYLDARMDYEDALAQWLVFSEQPPLQLFIAASQHFGWNADHLNNIHQHYGASGRLLRLQELAEAYEEILQATQHYYGPQPPTVLSRLRGKTRNDFLSLNNQHARWVEQCNHADLESLQHYFEEHKEKRFQVYAVDLIFAVIIAAVSWAIFTISSGYETYGKILVSAAVAATGLLSVLLCVGVRAMDLYLTEKTKGFFSTIYRKIKQFNIAVWLAILVCLTIGTTIIVNTYPNSIFGSIVIVINAMIYISIPIRIFYRFAFRMERPIMGALRVVVDAIEQAEDIAKSQHKSWQIFIRLVLYICLPFLIAEKCLSGLWHRLKLKKKVRSKASGLAIMIGVWVLLGGLYATYQYSQQQKALENQRVLKQQLEYKNNDYSQNILHN